MLDRSFQMPEKGQMHAKGWQLVTAQILYRLPDHPRLLQSFITQIIDLPPQFPSLRKFLQFWETNLDGPIHSVEIASRELFGASEFQKVDGVWTLH
jgi:uncharacterized protein Usg